MTFTARQILFGRYAVLLALALFCAVLLSIGR